MIPLNHLTEAARHELYIWCAHEICRCMTAIGADLALLEELTADDIMPLPLPLPPPRPAPKPLPPKALTKPVPPPKPTPTKPRDSAMPIRRYAAEGVSLKQRLREMNISYRDIAQFRGTKPNAVSQAVMGRVNPAPYHKLLDLLETEKEIGISHRADRWNPAVSSQPPPAEDGNCQHCGADPAASISGDAQTRILQLLIQLTGEAIDGSGCDSGDPLDVTLADIRHAIGITEMKAAERAIDDLSNEQLEALCEMRRIEGEGEKLEALKRQLQVSP